MTHYSRDGHSVIFFTISPECLVSDSVLRYNGCIMPSLRLRGVSMAYGRRTLFSGVEADVLPGRTLVVSGANGSGKSTLLRIAAGLLRPDEGRAEFLGQRGYAAPDVQLYGELTAEENLAFFARLRGVPAGTTAERLAEVGLSRARAGDLVSTYSSGMRQRLKLAVSRLGEPPLLLWDEPTATLDEAGRATVGAILDRHRAAGGIAVVATNDAAEAERWGDLRLSIG